MINQKKTNFFSKKNNFLQEKTIKDLDKNIIKSLYKLQLKQNSIYRFLINKVSSPIKLNKSQLFKGNEKKLNFYKLWSLKKFINTLYLLQEGFKTNKFFNNVISRSRPVGGYGLPCHHRNRSLPLPKPPAKRKNKLYWFNKLRFSKSSRFEFFIPRSQLKNKFSLKRDLKNQIRFKRNLNQKELINYSYIKKFTECSPINLLKIKIFRFKFRHIKRFINIVGGQNKFALKKKRKFTKKCTKNLLKMNLKNGK